MSDKAKDGGDTDMSGRGFAGAVEQLLGFGSLYHHSGSVLVDFSWKTPIYVESEPTPRAGHRLLEVRFHGRAL